MMRKVALPLLGLAAFVAACSDESVPTAVQVEPSFAAASAAQQVAGQYIVVFNNNVSDAPGLARQLTAQAGGRLGFTYTAALKGFSANMSAQAAEALSRNPNVAFVESDQIATAVTTTQSPATWGLDRIDQRALPLNSTYSYDVSGAGVRAYILDTGIRRSHAQFGGRAVTGYDAVTSGGTADDCNGHGTHVAGTVGGSTYGVAKGVTLVAVRVLDCSGSAPYSTVIAGVDWLTANRVLPAVANMSLGGPISTALDLAIQNAIASGVTFAVAAGNGNSAGVQQDACGSSPARVPQALTVGATNSSDVKASWSNYGSCVDLFAPGVNITSSWYTGDTATNTISGTSMASPHVAGVAALYLETNPTASAADVSNVLFNAATKGIVTSSSTANNNLLVSFFSPAPPAPLALAVSPFKNKGVNTNNLSWSGATTSQVILYFNGAVLATVSNTGSYTHNLGTKGGGSGTYRVCETGGGSCSPSVTASW